MLQNLLYTLYCLWSYDWHVKSRNQKGVYNCIILVFLENMLILCLSTWYLMGKGWSPVMNEFSSPDFVDIIFLNVLFFSEICSFMLKTSTFFGLHFPLFKFLFTFMTTFWISKLQNEFQPHLCTSDNFFKLSLYLPWLLYFFDFQIT